MDEVLTGNTYPKDALYEGWEVILRNQFHDILPGSSIKEVYEDSKEEYEKIYFTFSICIAGLHGIVCMRGQ